MPKTRFPLAVTAQQVPVRSRPSVYPEPFASRVAGREKRLLGEAFGLTNFGVNLTQLAPGAVSSLRHSHTRQDEFVYILQGHLTLHTNAGATVLAPGDCAGFKANSGDAHCLKNETNSLAIYLEVGDRTLGDQASYPDDDLHAIQVDGQWTFQHKSGAPYP